MTMERFAKAEWERANRTLLSARQLVEADPDSAASRAYYAAFHAVTAFFALQEISFTKHTAVRAAIHRDLIRNGQWDVSLGRDYDFLMELRETGDYGGLVQVSQEAALNALKKAENIVRTIGKSCSILTDSLPESN